MTPEAEKLVVEHLDLVRQVAARLARRLPAFIEMSEIISAGNLGLVEAASRFDPELHASFKVWAMIRIRGAIIDAYRGRNYPRLMNQMPEEWITPDAGEPNARLPHFLVDPSRSIEEILIERQESVTVITHAVRAHAELPETEREAVTAHLHGQSLREIGRTNQKSGAWAHYTLNSAKIKMRGKLGVEIQEQEAA